MTIGSDGKPKYGLWDLFDQACSHILRLEVDELIDIIEYKMTDLEQDALEPFMSMTTSGTFSEKRNLLTTYNKYRKIPRIDEFKRYKKGSL